MMFWAPRKRHIFDIFGCLKKHIFILVLDPAVDTVNDQVVVCAKYCLQHYFAIEITFNKNNFCKFGKIHS